MSEIPFWFESWAPRFGEASLTNVYQVSSLELAAVVLYMALMLVLSAYGLHRYHLIHLYYRYRDHALGEPSTYFTHLPRVTVQLPIYNEQYMVEELVESVCLLDYPRHLLDIQVLDDSTDETKFVAQTVVERWAAEGHPIEYIHRHHREGFKAGALQAGLRRARGEFIAIFDADFRPNPDFLHRTIHYFTDPKAGVVQARWTYRNREESLLTRVQAILLDGHFVFEHGARFRSGRFFNFNGTAGLLRRSMIEDAGGWQHDTLTEDTDLSYRAQLRGWKYLYLPQVEVPSELPSDLLSFQVQQARWAKGLIQTGMKILPRLLRADVPKKVKLEGWFHLSANLSYPLMALLSLLLLPATIVRFAHGDIKLLLLDIPLFLGTISSLSTFYLLSQKELEPHNWRRNVVLMPFLVAVGIGLTITNTKAVLEALLGVKSPFQRTAKYAAETDRTRVARRKYRGSAGWLPLANSAVAAYFTACLGYCAAIGNWLTVPFLGLFCVGYFFTAGKLSYEAFEQRFWNQRSPLFWLIPPDPPSIAPSYVMTNSASHSKAESATPLLLSRTVAMKDR
jgi:cellulose synthase/poly-beta-1,6-N-acetylglucosamine synthase-like glycosyltransferase